MKRRSLASAAALALAAGSAGVLIGASAGTAPAPGGFWWRTVTGQVGDCGPSQLTGEHPGVIAGYGPGDMQSVLVCPPRPWGNGSVNPS